jgi:hypothetical protein
MSSPGAWTGIARAKRDPLPHSGTLHYHAYTECSAAIMAGITPR